MLSGSRPFDRGTPIATALAHVRDTPPPLPDGTPADLAALVDACLAKDPDDRPSAALVAQMMEPGGDATVTDEPEPALPRRALVEG